MNLIGAALTGGLAGALVNNWFVRRQSKRELKSLILAFATELTLAFERCVLYHGQVREGKISFSSLFDFTDPSMLSRLATVTTEPGVVAAIIDLKSIYFQIRRQVEEAARNVAYATRLSQDGLEEAKYMRAATKAQRTALAFFLGEDGQRYKKTVEETALILDVAKKISPGKVVEDLEKKFEDAKRKKAELNDLEPRQKKREEKQNKS